MLPTLRQVLDLPALRRGEPVVRAGGDRLDEPVRWVHVSEISDIGGLLEGGELILTTGIALPSSTDALQRYVTDLVAAGVCGVVVELGRRYRRSLPAGLVAAADSGGLPLVELHRETPFVAVTQAVHTLVLDARVRELGASDERQRHRTLLTALALTPTPPGDVAERAAALGVPFGTHPLTGLAIRTLDGSAPPALLREVANRVAETLRSVRTPALVGLLDDQHVAVVLSHDDPGRAVAAVSEHVHTVSGRRTDTSFVIGVGASRPGARHAADSLREAVRVSDTAAALPPRRGWFRSADLRLPGLVHDLRDSPVLREYVRRELGPLLADGPGAERGHYEVLAAYCRSGGNKTAAAAALFVSRASLYDRLARIERILDVDLTDPGVVLGLHLAVLAHETATDPGLAVRPG